MVNRNFTVTRVTVSDLCSPWKNKHFHVRKQNFKISEVCHTAATGQLLLRRAVLRFCSPRVNRGFSEDIVQPFMSYQIKHTRWKSDNWVRKFDRCFLKFTSYIYDESDVILTSRDSRNGWTQPRTFQLMRKRRYCSIFASKLRIKWDSRAEISSSKKGRSTQYWRAYKLRSIKHQASI